MLFRSGDVAARVVNIRLEQHAVARCLVELNVVLSGQQILELCAVKASGPADQGETRDIEGEFILVERFYCGCPIGSWRQVIYKSRISELGGNHFVGTEDPEVLRDERMRIQFAAQVQR